MLPSTPFQLPHLPFELPSPPFTALLLLSSCSFLITTLHLSSHPLPFNSPPLVPYPLAPFLIKIPLAPFLFLLTHLPFSSNPAPLPFCSFPAFLHSPPLIYRPAPLLSSSLPTRSPYLQFPFPPLQSTPAPSLLAPLPFGYHQAPPPVPFLLFFPSNSFPPLQLIFSPLQSYRAHLRFSFPTIQLPSPLAPIFSSIDTLPKSSSSLPLTLQVLFHLLPLSSCSLQAPPSPLTTLLSSSPPPPSLPIQLHYPPATLASSYPPPPPLTSHAL